MKQSFYSSIRHAVRGVGYAYRRERNIRVQSMIACVVIVLALVLKLSLVEWSIILLSISFVLAIEFINSVIEASVDVVKPRLIPQIKIIKDMMAGAVLLVAVFVSIIGVLIFFPHVFELFSK